MKNLSNDCAAAAGADSGPQMKDNAPPADDVQRDLQIVGVLRKNLLLVGDARTVRVALDVLWLDIDEPVLRWRPGQTLELPCGGYEVTLVLHDVGELTGDEQTRMLHWFDHGDGRIRVISTSTDPVWPRVTSGAFNETLYYRLNTVHVDVSSHAPIERFS
jgi:hypothetical protein